MNAQNPIGWPFYPYVVAYATPEGVQDVFHAFTRNEAQDFVRTLEKQHKVRVFKLKADLIYFRAGKAKPKPVAAESAELEHEIDPTASFI